MTAFCETCGNDILAKAPRVSIGGGLHHPGCYAAVERRMTPAGPPAAPSTSRPGTEEPSDPEAAVSTNSVTEDIAALLGRIDALQSLLVCYRIGKHPSERVFDRLERTKADETRIREAHGFAK